MKRRAFTLIEMLVVVGVIALLVSLLVPALSLAKEQAKSVTCLNNLRQFSMAAHIYSLDNQDYYPKAYMKVKSGSISTMYCWDFTTITDWSTKQTQVVAGMLWQGQSTIEQIHQCPSYFGSSNTAGDPYTGYNYNTSYIGHGSGEIMQTPARVTDVKSPSECALFGDGEIKDGANKYMRSPWKAPGMDEFDYRYAGTQGYRHHGSTNVAYCDGRAQAVKRCFTDTYDPNLVAAGTGFLSPDNSAYDLN